MIEDVREFIKKVGELGECKLAENSDWKFAINPGYCHERLSF